MSELAAQTEISNRLNTQWGATTPISYPNAGLTPPVDDPWIELTVTNGTSEIVEIGNTQKTYRHPGVIFINVFTKLGIGDALALTLAEQAANIFNCWGGQYIQCRAASIKNIGSDGNGRYQVTVTIPYKRDEIK